MQEYYEVVASHVGPVAFPKDILAIYSTHQELLDSIRHNPERIIEQLISIVCWAFYESDDTLDYL